MKVDADLEDQENVDIQRRTTGLVVYYDTNIQVCTYTYSVKYIHMC